MGVLLPPAPEGVVSDQLYGPEYEDPSDLLQIDCEGLVGLDPSVRNVLEEVQAELEGPTNRWAIFIVSHFIVVAFEW
jgi:hypothetical protein